MSASQKIRKPRNLRKSQASIGGLELSELSDVSDVDVPTEGTNLGPLCPRPNKRSAFEVLDTSVSTGEKRLKMMDEETVRTIIQEEVTDKVIANNATLVQLLENSWRSNLTTVVKEIIQPQVEPLIDSVKQIERRLDHLEATNSQRVQDVPASQSHTASNTMIEKYWDARCSLRFFPVDQENDDLLAQTVCSFLEELGISSIMVKRLKFFATKVPVSGSLGNANDIAKRTVQVAFSTVEERDKIISYTYKLPRDSPMRVRIVVPDHLLPNYRRLEHLAFNLRKNPDGSRTSMKTFIKFDDDILALRLMVKNEGEAQWKEHRLQPSPLST